MFARLQAYVTVAYRLPWNVFTLTKIHKTRQPSNGAILMVKIFKHQGEPGWFLADESGAIVIDGCVDLDAAIRSRHKPFEPPGRRGHFNEQS